MRYDAVQSHEYSPSSASSAEYGERVLDEQVPDLSAIAAEELGAAVGKALSHGVDSWPLLWEQHPGPPELGLPRGITEGLATRWGRAHDSREVSLAGFVIDTWPEWNLFRINTGAYRTWREAAQSDPRRAAIDQAATNALWQHRQTIPVFELAFVAVNAWLPRGREFGRIAHWPDEDRQRWYFNPATHRYFSVPTRDEILDRLVDLVYRYFAFCWLDGGNARTWRELITKLADDVPGLNTVVRDGIRYARIVDPSDPSEQGGVGVLMFPPDEREMAVTVATSLGFPPDHPLVQSATQFLRAFAREETKRVDIESALDVAHRSYELRSIPAPRDINTWSVDTLYDEAMACLMALHKNSLTRQAGA